MGDNASFQILSINDILPNRFQPRIKFEDEALDELAESINRFGVIEPIVVRPIGNKFEIIAGERRYKASKLASKTTIPSIVINLSDKDSEELALLENVQRQSLNPIEEAVSYKRILDMGYITRDELSKKIGKPQSVILNKIRLLKLADEVQSYLLNNKISERHARALLNITNLDDQVEMLHRIVNERLTVKQTNREIRDYIENNKDVTETLFNDERGNDKVDIDKIMREAQDINVESNVSSEAPDLMATPAATSQENNSQLFESTPVNTESVTPQEPNKFVNVQPSIDTLSSMNGMIQQENQISMDNNSNNNSVTFDNMFNGPVNVQSSMNVNNANNSEPILNTQSIQPMSVDSVSNNSMNEEISSIVSDALKNQPIVNHASDENVTTVSNASLDNFTNIKNNNSINNDNNQVSDINGLLNNDVIPNSDGIVQNNGLETSTVSSDENIFIINQQGNNIQDNSIPTIEVTPTNNNEVSSTPQIAIPIPENQQVNVTSVVPNFAKIVQKLRECADEIEKNGQFVNLEEIDLGNQYKVIFTFDK